MSTTIPSRRTLAKIRFEVPGKVPSKSNYRHDAAKSSRWSRISKYEHEVGIEALRAGAGPLRRKHGENPVGVEIVAVGQTCDLDNLRKVIYDGLEGIAFENDRQVVADRGEMLPDDGKIARVRITVVYFEEDSNISRGGK